MKRDRLVVLAATIIYVSITAYLGRGILGHPGSVIASDPGDPLFAAGVLHWNAHNIPWTHGWWQFPIYYPARDTLAFSEQFLGISVIAAPLAWIARDSIVTYNLITLLTFPACAVAMFVLARRLGASPRAAFIGGLIYGFAPYRMSQLPHLQMLAAFWAPVALIGLHAYVEQRRPRWLVLYGACWLLQGLANGYMVFFFSVLVGLWVLWFVVRRNNWIGVASVALATCAAALPLVPILLKYVTVHNENGFVRGAGEIRAFGADLASVLCAPALSTAWGWVRVACKPEGELFPGVFMFVVGLVVVALAFGWLGLRRHPTGKLITYTRRTLIVVGVLAGIAATSVAVVGPWRLQFVVGVISVSAARKPLLIALVALTIATLLTSGVRDAFTRRSALGFYAFAALLTFLLALGPTISFLGVPTGYRGPFSLFLLLPGTDSLRVPARFWLLTTLCGAVVAALVYDRITASFRVSRRLIVCIASCMLILLDGWIGAIPAQPVPRRVLDDSFEPRTVVMQLPLDVFPDIAFEWQAVTAGLVSVNGYSGYAPRFYPLLMKAANAQDDAVFGPLRALHDLDVVVSESAAPLHAFVMKQPDAARVGVTGGAVRYRLPRREYRSHALTGARIPVASVSSACNAAQLALVSDRNFETRWVCPPNRSQQLTIDLGRVTDVGGVVNVLTEYFGDAPEQLLVQTSVDGELWNEAWRGSELGPAIDVALTNPQHLRIPIAFPPRPARYVRVEPVAQQPDAYWVVAELEVWSR